MIFMINNNNIILVVYHLIPNAVPMLSLLIIKFVMNYHGQPCPHAALQVRNHMGEIKHSAVHVGEMLQQCPWS